MTVLKVIKNAGRHALSRRYIFEKTKGMGGQIDPSLQVFFLGLISPQSANISYWLAAIKYT